MLARQDRLHLNKDIEQVFQRGRGQRSQFFYLKYLRKGQITKANVIVSLKVSKKSVIRHLLKRQALAILAPRLPKLQPGYYSIVIQPQAVGQTFAKLKEDLDESLLSFKKQV